MPTHEEDTTEAPFQGYTSPNYTQVPDELFDQQLPDLSGAELKVLLYIMRRTFGFKKDSDDISLNQICRGITTRDGRVLDRGTGLSKSTAQLAIKGLLAKNIILTTKRVSKEKGNEATTYELNVPSRRPYTENRHRGAIPISDTALYRKSAQQETVTQQTDLDPSKFEGFHDDVDNANLHGQRSGLIETVTTEQRGGEDAPESRLVPLGDVARLRAAAAATIGSTSAAMPASRTPDETPPRRGRAVGTAEERELLAAYLADFVVQLGDEAPLSSTVTRTLKILKQASIPMQRWPDLLYEAKSITWEHSAQIKKKPSDPAKTGSARVRVPYYLAVLEQLVGLRPAPERSVQGSERASW